MRRPKHFLDRKETIATCSLKNANHLNALIRQGRFFKPCGRAGNKHFFCEALVRSWAEMYQQTGAIPTRNDVVDIILDNLIETYN